MTPYYGQTQLSFTAAQQTLQLTYLNTLLYDERGGAASTGLDALAVRPAQSGYPTSQLADPPLPIPSTSFNHLTLDLEGLALASDGTYDGLFRFFPFLFCFLFSNQRLRRFWISDEYGPYIYHFDGSGNLIQSIQPPQAIVPLNSKGQLNFTPVSDPNTGRAGKSRLACCISYPLIPMMMVVVAS